MENSTKNSLITKAERKINKDNARLVGDKLRFHIADIDRIAKELQEERKRKNMSMFITIRPIVTNKYRDLNHKFSFFKDHEFDLMYGMLIGFHQDGNPKWRMIEINDSVTLNLDIIEEAKMWVVIRMSPRLKGSPFEGEDPMYEVYDPSIIAKANSTRRKSLMRAFDRINKMTPVELLLMARVMNVSLYDKITYSEIVDKMSEVAEANPQQFNNEFDNPSRKIKELVISATMVIESDGKPIIEQSIEKGYLFKGVYLGDTVNEVISKVTKDVALQNRIQDSLNTHDGLLAEMTDKKLEEVKLGRKEKEDVDKSNIEQLNFK